MPNMHLTPGQRAVLQAFQAFGKGIDDAGLAVYVHHVADLDMSSSGVRSRRAELERKGYVAVVGVKRTKSGRNAAIHGITAAGRAALMPARKATRRTTAKVAV